MQAVKRRAVIRHGAVISVSVDDISPNPVQPRKIFKDAESHGAPCSIAEYGILNPLTVRMRNGRYELVAGERRLRAAKLAGLSEVPCILLDVGLEDASLLALIENLQRRDLDFIEEANGISKLIGMFGMSQEEAARRLGKSQSAIANKLRLLKLPQDVLDGLREGGLTERHGRALLRLDTPDKQRAALCEIVRKDMTVAVTDAYIDSLLEAEESNDGTEGRRTFIMKDVRVFMNTILHGIDLMKQGGIAAGMKRQETEDELILTISIPKNREPQSQKAALQTQKN